MGRTGLSAVLATLIAMTASFAIRSDFAAEGPREKPKPVAVTRDVPRPPDPGPGFAGPSTPPATVQGIYLTCWSAGTESRIRRTIQLAGAGQINLVVIDIKDASGYVAFDCGVPDVSSFKARRVTIRSLRSLVQRFHEAGLYVVARLVVFQDPVLAEARPNWAVHSAALTHRPALFRNSSTLWRDRKGLTWMDPAATQVWDYNLAIAKDAFSRGVDEVNFDYVRFPSDGRLDDMLFPNWNGSEPRRAVLRRFFARARRTLEGRVISADLFGLATVKRDDLGIGQVLEDALPYFDFVCPMVYPSHFARGFLGKDNPADYPFNVVHYALKRARQRLEKARLEDGVVAKLRPWLQDFSIGAVYDAEMVRDQIQAIREALGEDYCGYLLWSPSNRYSCDALAKLPDRPGPAS